MTRQRGSIILYGVLALAIIGALSGISYKIYQAGAQSVRLEWEQANREQREREAEQGGKASDRLEKDNAKAKVITRTITKVVDKIIDRPVYRNVCLDADGLCLANAAIRGESAAACEPDKPLPAVRTVERWDGKVDLALDYALGTRLQ